VHSSVLASCNEGPGLPGLTETHEPSEAMTVTHYIKSIFWVQYTEGKFLSSMSIQYTADHPVVL